MSEPADDDSTGAVGTDATDGAVGTDAGDAALGGRTEARLEALEADDDRRRAAERLDRRFELGEAILLSLAAVLAAWAGFQAAKWSGTQADAYAQAGSSRVEATRIANLAGQQALADVTMFEDWLAALEREGLLDDRLDEGTAYVPDPEKLSGFLFLRFRDEFRPALDGWIALRPGTNADAPKTPFDMPEYKLVAAEEAQRLEEAARSDVENARKANDISDNYVLVTILFATVLFCAGISSKLDTARARAFLLGTGIVLFVGTTAVLLSFPKEF